METSPDLGLSSLERVTRIELALSAWESVPSGPVAWPDLRDGLRVSVRERPFVTEVNGPLMARGLSLANTDLRAQPLLLLGKPAYLHDRVRAGHGAKAERAEPCCVH